MKIGKNTCLTFVIFINFFFISCQQHNSNYDGTQDLTPVQVKNLDEQAFYSGEKTLALCLTNCISTNTASSPKLKTAEYSVNNVNYTKSAPTSSSCAYEPNNLNAIVKCTKGGSNDCQFMSLTTLNANGPPNTLTADMNQIGQEIVSFNVSNLRIELNNKKITAIDMTTNSDVTSTRVTTLSTADLSCGQSTSNVFNTLVQSQLEAINKLVNTTTSPSIDINTNPTDGNNTNIIPTDSSNSNIIPTDSSNSNIIPTDSSNSNIIPTDSSNSNIIPTDNNNINVNPTDSSNTNTGSNSTGTNQSLNCPQIGQTDVFTKLRIDVCYFDNGLQYKAAVDGCTTGDVFFDNTNTNTNTYKTIMGLCAE